jgi:hypothetical protein
MHAFHFSTDGRPRPLSRKLLASSALKMIKPRRTTTTKL